MAGTGTVNASLLNMRSSPDGDVIDQLPKGTQVEILSVQGEWLQVNADQKTGFVKATFINENTGAPPPQPTGQSTGQGTGAAPALGFRFVGNNAVAPDGTQFGKKF